MEKDSLTKFIEGLRQAWGSLDSKLVMKAQAMMEELVRTPISESWLAALQGDLDESRELYRDPEHGFIILAHTEHEGLYRNPHDHGYGWVIYAVQRGQMEMGTFGRIQSKRGEVSIIRRETYKVEPGQSRVFLPGDIHDTRCVSSSVLMIRLTSCDLRKELEAKRMNRYAEQK